MEKHNCRVGSLLMLVLLHFLKKPVAVQYCCGYWWVDSKTASEW